MQSKHTDLSHPIAIPRHVAIIMDGNGRWAQARGKVRTDGHVAGVAALDRTVRAAYDLGIEYLTIYAFSTENWQRPPEEVEGIMNLLAQSIVEYVPQFMKEGIRLQTIGDLSRLDPHVQAALQEAKEKTAQGDKITLVVAISYSSHDEIRRAVVRMAQEVQSGTLSIEELQNSTDIAAYLDTRGLPDVDLLIRTGGEFRLSNFLLYQLSYAEMYFTDILWPDFGQEHLQTALEWYASRERRFGKVLQK